MDKVIFADTSSALVLLPADAELDPAPLLVLALPVLLALTLPVLLALALPVLASPAVALLVPLFPLLPPQAARVRAATSDAAAQALDVKR